jgi:hypothetical protein
MGTVPISETLNLEVLRLLSGNHESREKGVCLLEAVAWMAGEDHSDHPQCACPVLSAFGRSLNDRMPEDRRQELKPLIPLLVGSRKGLEVERKRMYFLADRAVRVFAPIALRACGQEEWAKKLEDLTAIVDQKTARSASKIDAAAYDAAAYDAAAYDAAAYDAAAAYAAAAAAYAADAAAYDAAAYDAAAYDAAAYAAAAADAAADAAAAAARKTATSVSSASSSAASERVDVWGKSIDVFREAIAIV